MCERERETSAQMKGLEGGQRFAGSCCCCCCTRDGERASDPLVKRERERDMYSFSLSFLMMMLSILFSSLLHLLFSLLSLPILLPHSTASFPLSPSLARVS